MTDSSPRRAYVVTGLGFGDEGKGAVVDYLTETRNVGLIVRHGGGAQAAHNVVRPDGTHHTFAQWGSGTLAKRIRTHLGSEMIVNPVTAINEGWALREIFKDEEDPLGLVSVDPNALVTTSYHVAANLDFEGRRGLRRHGTTGMGIGETRRLWIQHKIGLQVEDLRSPGLTRHRLDVIRDFYEVEKDPNEDVQVSAMTSWASRLRGISPVNHAIKNTVGDVIFEGAQGVLLDQDYGFHPHTTWSDTTSARAEEIWDKHGDGPITRIGVTRSFLTRHGEGPFPTEDWFPDETEKHNDSTGHAGEFRTGHLDLVLLRYALEVNPVDCLFVTWMDIGEEFLDSFRIPVATDYFFINPPLSDISPYFRDGHLNPPPVFLPNHAWMESVTRRLFHAKPKMDHIEKDAFLLWLSANTKTPVRFWSKGPTWKDVSEVQMVGDPTAIKEEAM